MRTLNVTELKSLMCTHESNLVHCHTNNLWTIKNNSNDDIEYVRLDNDAVELIAIWVKEDAVAHYLSESLASEDFGKEIYGHTCQQNIAGINQCQSVCHHHEPSHSRNDGLLK